MQSVQIGYFEYLLLLGFLHLPMPLALGANPTEGTERNDLRVALAAASESLLARELVLSLPTTDSPATLDPGLARLVRASSLAESLIVASSATGEQRRTWHYTFTDDTVVVHSSPHPRVHRLELVNTTEGVVDHLLAVINPHQAPDRSQILPMVDAGLLGRALGLVEQQQWQSAIDTLLDASVPKNIAVTIRDSLGTAPARYALVGVSNWRGTRPRATTGLIVRGAEETWYLEDHPSQDDSVTITTADTNKIATRLHQLVSIVVSTSR